MFDQQLDDGRIPAFPISASCSNVYQTLSSSNFFSTGSEKARNTGKILILQAYLIKQVTLTARNSIYSQFFAELLTNPSVSLQATGASIYSYGVLSCDMNPWTRFVLYKLI
jgi:hypothetical protein